MRNSKILKVAVCSAIAASLAASAAFSTSALTTVEEVQDPSLKLGVCGIFTGDLASGGWGADSDIPMTYNNGVWEAEIEFDVLDGYITDWKCDGNPTDEGQGIQFKIRVDNKWDDSWGNYDNKNGAWNSQYNYGIPASKVKVGDHVKFTAYLDTTKNDPLAIAADEVGEDDDPEFFFLAGGVKDLVVTPAGGGAADESTTTDNSTPAADEDTTTDNSTPAADEGTTTDTDTPAADEGTTTDTPADTTEDKDTATPATGDTTSAIALVAVVLASLGTAVVMTKKASSKD